MHAAVPPQVNDFSADAIISQLLLLDAQDPTKVRRRTPTCTATGNAAAARGQGCLQAADGRARV